MLLAISVPNHPFDLNAALPWRFPIEYPLCVFLALYWPRKHVGTIIFFLSLIITSLIILHLLDFGFYLAFDRSFNFLRDGHLITSAINLLKTGFGVFTAMMVLASVVVLGLMVTMTLKYCLNKIHVIGRLNTKARAIVAGAMMLLTLTAAIGNQLYADRFSLGSRVVEQIGAKTADSLASYKRSHTLKQALDYSEQQNKNGQAFTALKSHDVIIIFVESYGRSFIKNSAFMPIASQTLSSFDEELRNANVHVKSTWMTAPITGGQSWLSHATLHSGFTLEKQSDYKQLVSSSHSSLASLFQQSGWSTLGLIPGIQFEWPEGAWYGFNQLYTHQNFNYRGERFGYITIPDQFTLSHFNRQTKHSSKEVMATIALLSSHAPWTVLPQKLEWSQIGDGSIFNGTKRIERDTSIFNIDSLKQQYARSVQYTLHVVGEFINNYNRDALFIVLGDHQPAALIGGLGNSADVPLHFISRTPELISKLPETLWTTGVIPDDKTPPTHMAEFRRMLISLYR